MKHLSKKSEHIPTLYVAGIAVFFIVIICSASICGAKQDNNPLFGQVTPEQINAQKESTVNVTVSLWTDRSFSRMGLETKIPTEICLTEGKTNQEFKDFKPGEKRYFNFSFKVNSEKELTIFFTAKALDLKDEIASQVLTLVINPSTMKKSFIETDKSGKGYHIFGID